MKSFSDLSNAIGYRIGEPEIGRIHCVLRDEATLRDFILGLPEKNLVDLYKVFGRIVDDDGSPDGLQILVLHYEPYKLAEN